MQPPTHVTFDHQSFDRVCKTIKNMSHAKRQLQTDPSFATDLPEEIGIQLTHRCNLRCRHCFQWNDTGFFHHLSRENIQKELDIEIFQKIIHQTSSIKSNLYLWGGEPMMYSPWDELIQILEQDTRWTVLCTNGVLIEKKLESLLKISSSLALLISLDGLENDNDSIRGKGIFHKVIKNIDLILEQKEKGYYKGEISINCVINDTVISNMFDFLEYFEGKGVNTVYFCFPWYIPNDVSGKMDAYFQDHFAFLHSSDCSHTPSWHSYNYQVDMNFLDSLLDQIRKINSRIWNIRVRFQPALELHEVGDFLSGKEITAQQRKQCLASSIRMNVLPSGEVTVCKMFPEFVVGKLGKDDVSTLWHNDTLTNCRKIIQQGLMPVCSKCILLYLLGGS